MRLDEARRLGEDVLRWIGPHVERAEIAGSLRRGRPEVRDLEVVAIPKWAEVQVPDGLLVRTERFNALHAWALAQGAVLWIKPAVPGVVPWAVRPDGKYWRGVLNGTDVKLDLFLCGPENWGAILLIRTGSAAFSEAVATHGKRIGVRFRGGRLTRRDGTPIPTPDERDAFDALGLQWIPPEARAGPAALRQRAAIR